METEKSADIKEYQVQIEELRQELEKSKRGMNRLERDNRILSIMNDNAEKLRLFNERERKMQYLYNDLLLENCPNMIFLFNEDLKFVMCSNECLPLLEIKDREILKNISFIELFSKKLPSEWVDKIYRQNLEALDSRTPCKYEDTIVFDDLDYIHAQIAISPIIGEEGVCHGTVMTVNDITELTETKQKAEQASVSKSNFLANMSHEIRTPMNAVKGLSELLALTELTNQQYNYVHNIITSANSLLGIINDVLDFSKIDANKIQLIEGPYDVSALVSEMSNLVSLKAIEKGVALLIEVDPDMPKSLIGDDVRIKQVISNILSNAVKYTHEGKITLSIHMEEQDGKTELVCAVEDTGIGITEEDQGRLFDAFSRVNLQANRNIMGTGLGLVISKQLAITMGGDVTVSSVFGEGSIFTVRIPQKIQNREPVIAVKNPSEKKVLLLIEEIYANSAKDMLAQLNIKSTVYAAGSQADTALISQWSHCIYDDSFPEVDIRKIRQQMPNCVFVSLQDMRKVMGQSDLYDTVLFLPLVITELVQVINKEAAEFNVTQREKPKIDHLVLENVTALVVDDNEINRMVGGELLASYGADIRYAESGFEALDLCEIEKFDLIFMDHMMPEMDGIETTIRIRNETGLNQKTPIIALTANVINDMKVRYLESGMDDFLAKPIELARLTDILISWLPKEKTNFGKELSVTEAPVSSESKEKNPLTLIEAMDAFGMYSSDVLRELNGDYDAYYARMEATNQFLGEITDQLKSYAKDEEWNGFADEMDKMQTLIYNVGARDCAARARKLVRAAKDKNVTYINSDFYSLMGNMYMLEKKMAVLAPLASGKLESEVVPLNDSHYLYDKLLEMGHFLMDRDFDKTMGVIENMAAYSLDRDLDMALKDIKNLIEGDEYSRAIHAHGQFIQQYAASLVSELE